MTHHTTIRQVPGGPHAGPDDTAPDIADVIATHMRALHYAVRDRDTFADPGDAYRVLGDLTLTAERLPHVLDEIARFLRELSARSVLRIDDQRDPAAHIAVLTDAFTDATRAAELLAGAVKWAFQLTAPIGWDPDPIGTAAASGDGRNRS